MNSTPAQSPVVVRHYKKNSMLRLITTLLTVSILISCGQNKQEPQSQQNVDNTMVDTVTVLSDPKNNLNIQTNSFSEIDSSGILM